MELVPGEKWITVKCHSPACCRDIFVVSVPVEMANAGVLGIFSGLQPVRCPYCLSLSEYRPEEMICVMVEQSHLTES